MTSTTATEKNAAEQTPASETKPSQVVDEKGAVTATTESTKADEAPASPSKKVVAAPKPTVHKADFEEDTVYLYQFARCPTIPSVSPFCLKVETWLRMVGLKYEVSTSFL